MSSAQIASRTAAGARDNRRLRTMLTPEGIAVPMVVLAEALVSSTCSAENQPWSSR